MPARHLPSVGLQNNCLTFFYCYVILQHLSTDWPDWRVIHRWLSSHPQLIYRLSTGYLQTYQQQKLVVPRCSTRISTTGWFCRKFSVDGKPSSPENFLETYPVLNLSSPQGFTKLIQSFPCPEQLIQSFNASLANQWFALLYAQEQVVHVLCHQSLMWFEQLPTCQLGECCKH